jgi:hypothetical protein
MQLVHATISCKCWLQLKINHKDKLQKWPFSTSVTWAVMSFGVKNGGCLLKCNEFKDYLNKFEGFSRRFDCI